MVKPYNILFACLLLSAGASSAAKRLSGTIYDLNGLPIAGGFLRIQLICGAACDADESFTIGSGGGYEFNSLDDNANDVGLLEVQVDGQWYVSNDNFGLGSATIANFQLTTRSAGSNYLELEPISGTPQVSLNQKIHTVFPSGNLIANSSFESEVYGLGGQSTRGWAGQWGGVLSRVGPPQEEAAQHGYWALMVSTTTQSNTGEFQGAGYAITEEDPAFKAIEEANASGRPVTISAWVKADASAIGKSIVFGNVHSRGTTASFIFNDQNWHKIHYTFNSTQVHPNTFAYRVYAFSIEELNTSASAFTFYIDNILLSTGPFEEQEAPQTALDFSDGEAKLLQTQSIQEQTGSEALSRIVYKKDYDVFGRLGKSWLPFTETCLSGSCQGISTDNPNDSYQGGANGLPNAEGFAYSAPVYESDQLMRIFQAGEPGALYQPSQGHLAKESHSATNDLLEASLGSNRSTPANTENPVYSYVHSRDANGNESMVWKDQLGNVVKQSNLTEGRFISSRSVFDDKARVIKTLPPISCEDAAGNATPGPNCVDPVRFDYDQMGNLTKETSPDFGEVKKVYNVAGQLRASQSQSQQIAGHFMIYKYDKLGRMIETGLLNGDWDSQTSSRFIDNAIAGSQEIVNPEKLVFAELKPAYDGLGTKIAQIRSSNAVTVYQVVQSMNTEIQPPMGTEFTAFTDVDGTQIEVDFEGILRGSQQYTALIEARSGDGTAQGIEDGSWPQPGSEYQVLTRNFYDRVSEISPDLKTGGIPFILPVGEDAGFAQGRLLASVNYNPQLASLFPSLQERVVSTFFKYDAQGNAVTEYKYIGTIKAAGQRLQEVDKTFDVANRVITKTVWKRPSGSVCSDINTFHRFTFDGMGRMDKVFTLDHSNCSQEVQLAQYGYAPDGKLNEIRLGENGSAVQIRYAYHIRGWISNITAERMQCAPNGGSCALVTIFSQDFRYDRNLTSDLSQEQYNGNIADILYYFGIIQDSRSYVYNYDGLNRLLNAYYYADVSANDYMDEAFSYLDDGRISTIRRGGVSQTSPQPFVYHANSNRLKCVEDFIDQDAGYRKDRTCTGSNHDVPRFYYDTDGNRISTQPDGAQEITYDWRNMPWKFATPDGFSVMAYDASGIRVSKIEYSSVSGQPSQRGNAKHYIGSDKEIHEKSTGTPDFEEISNLSGTGSIGRILPTGIMEFYIFNHLGNVVTKVSETGNWLNQPLNDYFSYGKQVKIQMDDKAKVTEAFTGKELDEELGLSYFGARYYDADLATWISPDPARQFASPYAYGPNPVNGVDVDGNVFVFPPGNSPLFNAQAQIALSRLSTGGKTGAGIVNFINSTAGPTVVLSPGSNAAVPMNGNSANSLVTWDPSDHTSGLDATGGHERPAFIGLGHELVHALENFMGLIDNDRTMDPVTHVPAAEKNAMKYENRIRAENGVPKRVLYQSNVPLTIDDIPK